jgi:hypothetical protein
MLRITCKSGYEPAGVMNRFCQVNSLVVGRFAPNSQRMKSAALLCKKAIIFSLGKPINNGSHIL